MLRSFGILLAAFAVLHASKERRQQYYTSAPCVPHDVVFMVDSSQGVGPNYFRQELEFIKATINGYNISPTCVRVGIVTFSGQAYNQFYLNQYSSKAAMFNAIDHIQYHTGPRYTTEALKFVNDQSFSTLHGARNNVPHIGILISNGPSSNSAATSQMALTLKNNGVKLYTVGVGSGGYQQQLASIATNPSSRYALTAQNFAAASDLAYPLSYRTNSETAVVPSQKQQCLPRADIVFLVDGSGSIGINNFQKLQSFIKNSAGQLNIGPNKVHVGVMEFSNYPRIEFPLDMHTTTSEVMKAVDNIKYMGGGTNTADAITYMTNQMFSLNSGARSNVPRIGVVITDGRSSNPTATATAADKARQANIAMMAVGVGNGVDINELHSIADNPSSSNTFTVNSFDQLDSLTASIIQKACQVRTTAPSLTTSVPGATHQPDPCQDHLNDCKSYGNRVCVNYAPWSKDNCARFCGFCSPLYTTGPPPCVDRLNNCRDFGLSVCHDQKYVGWANDNCMQYCGFCGANSSSVGFYGQCFYKGKPYKHGEKWSDGCDYDCLCEDGQSGRYRCYNKCPLYYNLPQSCTLVQSPDVCCQKPVCNFNQNLQTIEGTAPAVTTSGVSVCSYKSKQYYEGQSWQDGCSYQCRCVTGSSGLYSCQSLCPQYGSIPPYCKMVKTPGECCSKPECEFTTQQGSFTGTGSISGPGVGIAPTNPPACDDQIKTCERYGKDICTNYAGWASENCRKYCNLCNVTPTPAASDKCVYRGHEYSQGQAWKMSCDTQCVCEDASYGYYRCTNVCPTYTNLPQGCYQTKKAGECCASVQCATGTFLTSTNNLNTIGSGGLIQVQNPGQPQITPNLPGGGVPQPGAGGTGFTAPTLRGCLYKGNLYLQDQSWDDGCSYSCTCTHATSGRYSCKAKCPTYYDLPTGCHMETDINEPCCQVPKCTNPKTPLIPIFQPGSIGHGAVKPPSTNELFNNTYTVHYQLMYTDTVPPPTASHITSKPGIGYCEYKGVRHIQGDTWRDGCQYNCVCEDASIGKWRCRERCKKFDNLPKPYCQLVPDPNDNCCHVPHCDFQSQIDSFNRTAKPVVVTTRLPLTTPTPKPTTPRPRICVYNGKQYSQGQMWYDGCQYKCTCDDAQNGFFRCTNRCPQYLNVPDGCTMVPDLQDPTCCKVPQCNFSPTVSNPGGQKPVPTLQPGQFSGQNPDSSNNNVGYCEYKDQRYGQGQTWTDGCDYSCECKDIKTGLYECTERCPRYGSIPPPCKLITDFRNPCCKVPDCGFGGTFGEITGTLTPAPNLGTTGVPPIGGTNPPRQTPAPVLNYCLYNGVRYYQGQTWEDGCDKRCRCDDSSKGLYVCDTRCPTYPTPLPKECKLAVSPTDPCCQEPQCDIPSSLKNITGTISPNMIPTLAPPGQITGHANTPAPTPGISGNTPSPSPINYCEYKGTKYNQGQRWDDGCDYTCECVNSMNGYYTCTEKCPRYGTLPPQCSLQKDPANPCCRKPECAFNPSVNQIVGQGTTKAPLPGQTYAPTPAPSGRPNVFPTPALPKDVCVYRGKSYTQGQQWYDGCQYSCTCEDAPQGIYRCSKRCPQYDQQLQRGCYMVQDPKDPLCCKMPKCDIPPQYSNYTGYVSLPTPKPGIITGGSVTQAPTPAPQPTPAPGITYAPGLQPTPGATPKPREVCIYKGTEYSQGQKWDDGCDYTCECMDAKSGYYQCTEKCPRYPNMPPQCQLVSDYLNPCCKKPYCNFKGVNVNVVGTATPAPQIQNTIAPVPGQSTPKPQPTPKTPTTCMYNGVPFKQGQTWDDGCDLKCICEDGMTGFYRCSDRCAKYPQVPQGCILTTDPRDSCCRVPVCQPVAQTTPAPKPGVTQAPNPGITQAPNPGTLAPNPGVTQAPNPGVTQAPNPGVTFVPNPNNTPVPNPQPSPILPTVPAVIIGQGVTPSPRPGQTPSPNPVCVYKGVTYQQGARWQDGCDYNCECIDANIGKYRCTERCQRFVNVPSNCRLESDLNDPCCKRAVCSPTPGPNPNVLPTPAPTPGGVTVSPPKNPTPGTGTTQKPNPFNTLAPSPQPTPGPQLPKDVCIMNGRQYTQGQQWYDGCSRKCVCEDGHTGFYRCVDRCRKYTAVPSTCTMIADPNDPICCRVPQCIPTPGVNGFPTAGPTDKPLPITNVPVGVVTGYATPPTVQTRPTVAPNPNASPNPNATPAPTPAPREGCVYKGTQYGRGQKWQDGCDYICECVDSMTGKYQCTERCPSYPLLPPMCKMQTDPKDYCCQIPVCDYTKPIPTPAPGRSPSPQPGFTPNPKPTAAPQPGVSTQKPVPHVTPGQNPTPGPVLAFCVYNGIPFKQGQTWDQGCDKKCRCDDAMNNLYTCQDRCPSYQVNPGCIYVTNPNDPCCQVPQCTVIPSPQPTPKPNPNPTPGPGQNPGQTPIPGNTVAPNPFNTNPTVAPGILPGVTPNPSPNPSPVPTGQTGVIFGKPQIPSSKGVCEYKGRQYTTGQKFDDGCQYKCECIDGMSGSYRCTERCPVYPSIPSYCIKVQDPNDQCCETVSCPNLNPTPSPNQTPAPIPNQFPRPGTTVAPVGVNTPVPNVNPQPGATTLSPNMKTTPGPLPTPPSSYRPPVPKNVCIMNGRSYTQGQKWNDGCSKICVCDDGITGHYTCSDRCPQYQNIAPSCIMVPDPNDPTCCKIPDCNQQNPNPLNPNPTPPSGLIGSVTGINPLQTTPRPNPQPTAAPNPNNPNPTAQPNPRPNQTPQPYLYPTPYPGGTYPPQMLQNMTPRPQNTVAPIPGQSTVQPPIQNTPVPGTPSPAPAVCIYKGKSYTQGQRWRDGCDYNCVCEDGMTGRYKCTAVCPRYPNVPVSCRMVTDTSNPCCEKPDCSPTPAPQPGITPAPQPGQSPSPQNTPAPNPEFCIYNGIPYRQGQTWQDGCDKICRCEDAQSRQITCDDRCATYPPLKPGCTYITDPKDQCCQVPQCTNQQTPNPTNVVTGQKGTVSGGNLNPQGTNPSVGGKSNVCLYKGKMYQPGQTWDDGCAYTCVCTDGSTGKYKCTEKCPRIPQIPSSCTMIQDPNDQCCQKAYCPNLVPNPNVTPNPYPQNTVAPNPQNTQSPNPQNTPAPNPQNTQSPNPQNTPAPNPQNTLAPNPGVTPAPKPRDVCVYKNQNYKQDQLWYDGCNAICRCENAMTGFYRCQERCSRYTNVPSQCILVPDPQDPSCCQVPQCPVQPTAGPSPAPGIIQNPLTPKPGVITGLGPIPTAQPTPQPGQVPTSAPGVSTLSPPQQITLSPPLPKSGCYYKGMAYQKGQQWSDGCQYTCECLDDMTGQYRCVEKCSKFPNLDSRCVLVQDPQEPCCQKPYCDFVNPTPFPNGIPTPRPGATLVPQPGLTPAPNIQPGMTPVPQPTPNGQNPGLNPTPAPNSYCVYKGVFYKQGQQWFDGCDKTCQCDDSTTGYYSCHERCPTYNNIPSNCVLKTDPNDQCCLAPDCYTNLFPIKPTGPQTFTAKPNSGTGPSGTINPQTTYGTFTGTPQYIYPTPIRPGSITGTSGNNPNGQPVSSISSTGGRNACVYKGKVYTQGQQWDDGCQYRCECIDSTRGQYRCTGRCSRYMYLPPQCTYIQDPNDACCKVARCNPNATPAPQLTVKPTPGGGNPIFVSPGGQTGPSGTFNPQQGTSGSFTGGNTPFVVNPQQNTGPSGTNSPNPRTTYSVITGAPTACIYKGKLYQTGQRWQDGCDYNCVCENPSLNSYKCSARCKVFSGVPSFCSLRPDPNDQCCKTLQCTAPNGQQLTPMIPGLTPTMSPTLSPSIMHVVPIGSHNVISGTGVPQPGTNNFNGGRRACFYKNQVYHQGESWDDGCDYVCTCENESTGKYKCTSKCPQFPPIPSYCKFTNIPGQCCPSLSCNSPDYGKYNPTAQLVPTPAPTGIPVPGTTLSPQIIIAPGTGPMTGGSQPVVSGRPLSGFSGNTNNLCIYKNKIYNPGDSWTDGCDYNCTCMDGRTGYYDCKALCPTYTNLPSQCYLVRASGDCCPHAMCTNPDGTQVNPMNPGSVYPVYGSYPGGYTGFRPNYVPGQAVSGQRNICVYKGMTYSQGQKWDDGCDYSCTCTNAQSGLYQCHKKCPSYTSIPSVCRLVDVPGDCCQEVRCDNSKVPTTQMPVQQNTASPHIDPYCFDLIDNCKSYGQFGCNKTYEPWARKNCNRYCGFCTPGATTPRPCVDQLNNCASYGSSACTGIYKPWAEDNCIKTCGLCGGQATPAPVSGPCTDKLSNCDRYDKSACTDSKFTAWAHDNCRKFCNFCPATGVPSQTVVNSLPGNGWMTMLKGVSGVPGDLYNLWISPNTANPNVPQAMYLNALFPGHFKPGLSNNWNSLCIDKVKVAIYNKGIEKANIIFDAHGADKNSWFDSSRIISSTYTDIKNAPKEFFSLMGDVSSGREFYMNSQSSGTCNSYGWIMVATKNGCPFEANSGNKPSFFYSTGQSATQFGQSSTGQGDVFAILAHGDCTVTKSPQATAVTGRTNACIYTDNKIYHQGETWVDGCRYNCTCTDASTGRYTCSDLCPVYTQIPQGCSLLKKPGQCCSVLDCGGVTFGNTQGICLYKGKVHLDGSSWNDGCDYKCACNNGQYKCTARCYNWNLPPGLCTMQAPAPGKCCQTPKCPSNVILQYPDGYVEE